EPVEAAPGPDKPAATPALRRRRGRRGAGASTDEMPPLLEGQTVRAPAPSVPPVTEPVAATVQEVAPPAKAPAKRKRTRGQGRAKAAAAAPAAPAFSAAALGLPVSPDEIMTYLSTQYKGVGKKSAETLLDRFGSDVFQ